jgi:hypothetical protein
MDRAMDIARIRKEVAYLVNRLSKELDRTVKSKDNESRLSQLSRNATLIKVRCSPFAAFVNSVRSLWQSLSSTDLQLLQSVMVVHIRGGTVDGMGVKDLEALR